MAGENNSITGGDTTHAQSTMTTLTRDTILVYGWGLLRGDGAEVITPTKDAGQIAGLYG